MVLSLEQQDAVWERWRAGEPVRVIARAVCCNREAVRRLLAVTGGIRPAARSRAPLRLSLTEREEISRGLAAGDSARAIATRLRRSASSVSREIARNGGPTQYRAAAADRRAWENARRPKPCKLETHDDLRSIVQEKLMADWSPQQIAAWLRLTPASAQGVRCTRLSTGPLYISSRLSLPSTPKTHLRSGRGMRTSRKARRTGHGRGRLRNMVSIHDRPEQIETRTEVGHWGKGPRHGATPQRRGNPRGTHHQDRSPRQARWHQGPRRPRRARPEPPRHAEITVEVDHLGSRSRDVRARTTRPRPRHPRLLLRSSLTVATRLEREHQPAPTPVPGEERRPVPLHSRRTRSDREQDQHTSTPGP